MSSAICHNFVQNAWKKELCSNCFKSKDEHVIKPKPVQLISANQVEGIIRNNNNKINKPKQSVCFLKDLTKIIGYGGEDWCSDNEEEKESESNEEEESIDSEEEESAKELQRITKQNTDFNTNSLGEEMKKSNFTHLLLGKPLLDASGRKQTLLVSVTPFGEDSSITKKYSNKTMSHIPIAKSNKDVIAETKTNVILTSYTKNGECNIDNNKEEKSLLDEISETLENNKNPIQIRNLKQRENNNSAESNKENIQEEKKEILNEKFAQTKSLCSEKKVNLTRTSPLKKDVRKPVLYQTQSTKVDLLNSKNLKLNSDATVGAAKGNTEVNNNINKTSDNVVQENKLELMDGRKSSSDLIKAEITQCKSEMIQNKAMTEKSVDSMTVISAKYSMTFTQSREQAGKPDGREDPVASEIPPLPTTPPPVLESQTSFLHGNGTPIYEKPKIPSKPMNMMIKKPISSLQLPNCTTEKEKLSLCKEDSNDSDFKGKRRAPKPPEESSFPVYTRNSTGAINIDSPVVRVKEKRERAASCAPNKAYNEYSQIEGDSCVPEPAPRKSLSVSTDCLVTERKEKQKARFSLKKFLRMGSNKDISKLDNGLKVEENPYLPSQSKSRLVIIHPSELNGLKVEVVAKPTADQVDYQTPDKVKSEYEVYSNLKAAKPPPPPRHYSPLSNPPKPILPNPPKSIEVINKQRQLSRSNSSSKKMETVYANIGEVRSSIVPNKPVRTASMREREAALQQKHLRKNHNYEPINVPGEKYGTENLYDYINSTRSSSPDSDSSRKGSPKCKTVRLGKRSESSTDVSGEYIKYNNIPRSMSLTYCGSETESEIYSPYSFYGSESEITEDDHDWIQNGRTHKLRSRKGRSIVHKNLEDNYGAVVAANHEALAQVLENIHQSNHIPPALRGLKSSSNLQWTDFSIKSGTSPVIIGTRAFYQALWGAQHVTLVINAEITGSNALSLGPFNLISVTEFNDLVPQEYIPNLDDHENKEKNQKQVQATISVLPWLQINTIQSYGEVLKIRIKNPEETWKNANFIMLQLVNALKTLQAQGTEELPLSLNSFILCKDMDKDSYQRLCVLQSLATDIAHTNTNQEKYGTLCTCALKALSYLQTSPKITPLIQSLLSHERAVSLTQVKSILEFILWGPSDVSLGSTIKDRELALQRWLDLQRATVLHGLVCTRVQLSVYEECHLLFLVRSNPRMMCDASLLIESSNMKHHMVHIRGEKYSET